MKARFLNVVGTICVAASLPMSTAQAASTLAALQANVQPSFVVHGRGDGRMQGQVIIPASSLVRPGDAGKFMHTHLKILAPIVDPSAVVPATATSAAAVGGPPYSGYYYETPASLACIYGLAPATTGCNPNSLTSVNNAPATNGSKAIAVVDAYDLSSAATDLQTYSSQFGLPYTSNTFQVIYGTSNGTKPSSAAGTGWDVEEALDIEMAHAMAPNATVYLVEAASASLADLNTAVAKATQLVQAAGGGEVSMSFGGAEFSTETSTASEQPYQGSGVVYFASTGDNPGLEFPSTSPNVVAVGGTSTSRRNDNRVAGQQGFFRFETAWSETGGGVSAYVPTPSYQSFLTSTRLQTGYRGVPDVSFDANPYTGVWVECSTGCNYSGTSWFPVGGTSVASPAVAALTNSAGSFLPSSASQLSYMYNKIGTSSFFDVSYGVCGSYAGYGGTAGSGPGDPSGWDFCTGVGSPRGLSGLGAGAATQTVRR